MPTPLTNHKTILLELNTSSNIKTKRTPSYWKLNNSVISNESLKLEIKHRIYKYLETAETENSYGKNWELLKFELKTLLMKTGVDLKKDRKKEENASIEIIALSSILSENMSGVQRAKLQTLQLKLDQLYIDKAKGAFVCSTAIWVEGEQFFFLTRKTLGKTIA